MGQDRDILILGWLNRQPGGTAPANQIHLGSSGDLSSLEQRGLVDRIPSDKPGGVDWYVITPEGKAFQTGD